MKTYRLTFTMIDGHGEEGKGNIIFKAKNDRRAAVVARRKIKGFSEDHIICPHLERGRIKNIRRKEFVAKKEIPMTASNSEPFTGPGDAVGRTVAKSRLKE